MKKILALVLSAIMMVSLAACSSGTDATEAAAETAAETKAETKTETAAATEAAEKKEPVKLVYWFEGQGTERTELNEKLIAQFNAEHEGEIEVEGVYVALDKGLDKINTAFAAGALPDVMYLQVDWESTMFAQDMCLQLDDYFNSWEDKDQFESTYLEALRINDMQGRLYGIPTSTNITGIWYRKDLFAEKGLDAPLTWDSYFNSIEAMTDLSNNFYGQTLRAGSGAMNPLLYAIVSYSGVDTFFDENGTCVALRNDYAKEYVQKVVDLFQKGCMPESSLTSGDKEMIADFDAGICATMVHNLGSTESQAAVFTPDQYGFVAFPEGVNGQLTARVPTVKCVSIAASSEHPAEAWEFVKYITSEDVLSQQCESVGDLPCRIDTASHEWVKNAPQLSQLSEYMAKDKVGVNIPSYLPEYSTIQKTNMLPIFQSVLVGEETVDNMMEEWATELEASNAEYMKQKNAG